MGEQQIRYLGWSRYGSRSPRCASSARWCCCTSISTGAAGASRRRKSWARSHGFDFERESTEILKRWKRGVMSTVGDISAHNVVLGQIRGEAVYIFDLEEVATVIALHRKVGTNVVVDLRLKGLERTPGERHLAARRDRTADGVLHQSGRGPAGLRPPHGHLRPHRTRLRRDHVERAELDVGRLCRSPALAPSGTRACAPCANSTTCCGFCRPYLKRPLKRQGSRPHSATRRRAVPWRRPDARSCRTRHAEQDVAGLLGADVQAARRAPEAVRRDEGRSDAARRPPPAGRNGSQASNYQH